MLAYLDRRPTELGLRARLALLVARIWANAMNARQCPLKAIEPVFTKWGVAGALWPAHYFLYWTLANAARPFALGCPCCGRIGDDEALLLSAMMTTNDDVARAALRDVVHAGALTTAVRLAGKLRENLLVPEER